MWPDVPESDRPVTAVTNGVHVPTWIASDLCDLFRRYLGDDFFLAYDCWMALTVEYTLRLIEALRPFRLKWIEEFLPPILCVKTATVG